VRYVIVARVGQGAGQLVRGELAGHLRHGPRAGLEPVLGVAAEQLRYHGQLAGGHVGLEPVPRAQQPDQLVIGHPVEAVLVSAARRRVGSHRQLRAAGRDIKRHRGAEPGRRARRLTGNTWAEPGNPGPRRPVEAAATASTSSAAAWRISASSSAVRSS
jgi:hypothetical protein